MAAVAAPKIYRERGEKEEKRGKKEKRGESKERGKGEKVRGEQRCIRPMGAKHPLRTVKRL